MPPLRRSEVILEENKGPAVLPYSSNTGEILHDGYLGANSQLPMQRSPLEDYVLLERFPARARGRNSIDVTSEVLDVVRLNRKPEHLGISLLGQVQRNYAQLELSIGAKFAARAGSTSCCSASPISPRTKSPPCA